MLYNNIRYIAKKKLIERGRHMFVPIKNKKIYQYVIEQIQSMVMNGTLKIGDKLPSERDLVEQLGVSRTSIREALSALEVIGLIESRQGEGNFISGNIESNFFEPLSVMFMLNKGNPEDILELRMIIEVEAAAIAAKNIKEEDKEEIRILLDRLANAENDKESAKLDAQLHYRIAEITGNYLIITLLKAVSNLMETFIENARVIILQEENKRELLMEQHKKICNALFEGDSQKVVLAMKEHLKTINDAMKKM